MAGELDREELEEWRTIFNLFDVDGDESITCQELGVVLRSMGQNPSDQELKEMINEMDEDGSGTVDFEVCSDFVTFPFLLHNTFLHFGKPKNCSVYGQSLGNSIIYNVTTSTRISQWLHGKLFKNNRLF
jgi:hypothetical protein